MRRKPSRGTGRGGNLVLGVGRGVAQTLGVGRGENLILGVVRGVARPLGFGEAETSSSASDVVIVAFLTIGQADVLHQQWRRWNGMRKAKV